MDDAVEKAFLSELEALEKFRISYSGQHPNAPLAREDPDVRRLIEAMAMFTARTRLASQRNIGQTLLRIFRQQFPFLTSPVPAMAMLRGKPMRRFVDATTIPSGTEVLLTQTGERGEEKVYRFQTLAKLDLRPLELEAVDIYRVRGRGFRLLLRFTTAFPRSDDLGSLRLLVNHLDDLFSSSTVFYQLQKHLKQATVVYGDKVTEETQGQPLEALFAPARGEPYDVEILEHPLQRARAMLRFPEQALFLELRGVHPPRNWQTFTVSLELDESWPTELRLTPDAFELHAVPMVNVRKDTSNPIECDGTKDAYSILHPERPAGFVAHSVLGVYRMTPEGLSPLAPAVLGSGLEGWDVTVDGHGEQRRSWLSLSIPGAFAQPERIVVEALWHQPALAGTRGDEMKARLGDRFVDGVAWSCLGSITAPAENGLADDRDALLQLLAMKSQRFLDLPEVLVLAKALGADKERLSARVLAGLTSVKVASKPYTRKSSGFKYVYHLGFERLDASLLPSLDLLARRLLEVLSAWSVEEVVELVCEVPNLGVELRFP
jgi:type VI secretion system protein ImpG